MRKALLALVPAVLLLVAVAAPATASPRQETIMQDDRLFGNPDLQPEALAVSDDLGVDTIHSVVTMQRLSPKLTSKKKPRGFNGADPGDYDAEDWDRFDDLVRGADSRGIDILFSPSGPVPRWASTCKRARRATVCGPKPKEYQAFFTAVVKRYNGRYKDENQGGGTLPKVDRFSVWNEPNLKSWLQSPSSRKSTAAIYRELVYAAERGLAKGGQRRAQLLVGELAPLRSLGFYEAFLCIDSRGRLLRGRSATKNGCKSGRRMKRLKATGIAHHPYARGGGSPFKRTKRLDITLRDIKKLQKAFNRGAKHRAVRRNLPVYLTEFGVSSDPPSRKFGLSLSAQAREINRAEFNAWRNRAVRSYAQFQLSDDTSIPNFQTGLRFGNLEPKPSMDAFRMPIWPLRKGSRVAVWGGVRPGAREQVAIQTGRGDTFTTVKTLTVNSYGYINTSIPAPSSGQLVRLLWTDKGGTARTSRAAKVEKTP